MHEVKSHDDNWFVTLTYSEEHVPKDMQLRPKHLQLFLKRLRKCLDTETPGARVRFYAVGEYGERTMRPHYHAILFGLKLNDLVPASRDLFQSEWLEKIWGKGGVRVGRVTPKSAQYVAGYCVNKMETPRCDADGVVLEPPFSRMSRRPGIGATWLDGFRNDLVHGFLVVDGVKCAVPRAYKVRLKSLQEKGCVDGKFSAEARSVGQVLDSLEGSARRATQGRRYDVERLRAAEVIAHARAAQLKKTF